MVGPVMRVTNSFKMFIGSY